MAPTWSTVFTRAFSLPKKHGSSVMGKGKLSIDVRIPFLVYYRAHSKLREYTFVTHGLQTVRAFNCARAIVTDNSMDIVLGVLENAYLRNPCLVLVTGQKAVCYKAGDLDYVSDPFTFENSTFDCSNHHIHWKEVDKHGHVIVDFRAWLAAFEWDSTSMEGYLASVDQLNCLDSSFPVSLSEKQIAVFLKHWHAVCDQVMDQSGYVRINNGTITHTFNVAHHEWSAFIEEDEDQSGGEDNEAEEQSEEVQLSREATIELAKPKKALEREIVEGLQGLDLFLVCGKYPEAPLEEHLRCALDLLDDSLTSNSSSEAEKAAIGGSKATSVSSIAAMPSATTTGDAAHNTSLTSGTEHTTATAPRMRSVVGTAAIQSVSSMTAFGRSASSFASLNSSAHSLGSDVAAAFPEDINSEIISSFRHRTRSGGAEAPPPVMEESEESAEEDVIRAVSHVAVRATSVAEFSTTPSSATFQSEKSKLSQGNSVEASRVASTFAHQGSWSNLSNGDVTRTTSDSSFVALPSTNSTPSHWSKLSNKGNSVAVSRTTSTMARGGSFSKPPSCDISRAPSNMTLPTLPSSASATSAVTSQSRGSSSEVPAENVSLTVSVCANNSSIDQDNCVEFSRNPSHPGNILQSADSSVSLSSKSSEQEKFIPTATSESIPHVRSMGNLVIPAHVANLSKEKIPGSPLTCSSDRQSSASTRINSVNHGSFGKGTLQVGTLPRNSSWPHLRAAPEVPSSPGPVFPSFSLEELQSWSVPVS